MFLLIGESLGLQELIFIGIFALIIFGPRRLPQIARKLGNMMAELRRVTNEFKSTWEREVEFESPEDVSLNGIAPKSEQTFEGNKEAQKILIPEIRELETTDFREMISPEKVKDGAEESAFRTVAKTEKAQTDKRDWL